MTARRAPRPKWVCTRCTAPLARWPGASCPQCGAFSTAIITIAQAVERNLALPVALLRQATAPGSRGRSRRLHTGLRGLDHVFGGGIMPGSSALVAGASGAGKTTALVQAAAEVAKRRRAVVASAEQSRAALVELCERLDVADRQGLVPLHVESVDAVLSIAAEMRPALLIVDSSSKLAELSHSAEAPIIGQLHAAAGELRVAIMIVSHVNAAGEISGPAAKRHAPDAVVVVEGSRQDPVRTWRAPKNRNAAGAVEAHAVMRMEEHGFVDVADVGPEIPRRQLGPGAALALVRVDGAVVAIEVQAALTSPISSPRRITTSGIPVEAVRVVASTVERDGVILAGDLVLRVYGEAPASSLDCAIAAALASASRGTSLPPGVAFAGGLGLDGVVREGDISAAEVASLGLRLLGRAGERLVNAIDRGHLVRVS